MMELYFKKLKDFKEWNSWRANPEGRGIRPSLANTIFSKYGIYDLQSFDFSDCDLSNCDFSGVNCINTNFLNASLEYSVFEKTVLTGANLARANLYKCQFRDVDARKASFQKANLTEATIAYNSNFQGASFQKAQLHRAQVLNSDLTNADFKQSQVRFTSFKKSILTGICIEDWSINQDTDFENIDCKYAFFGESSRKDERTESSDRVPSFSGRRPRSGLFKPGEFSTLLQQVFDTIDLIFVDGIDWQAFFASFQDLRQRYDDAELNVQAIEKKSGGSFLIRLEVSGYADKAAIERFAKIRYERELQLMEDHYQTQLKAKDIEIDSYRRESANMLEITRLLANKPIHVDHSNITTNAQGATIGNFANRMNSNASQTYNAVPDQTLAQAAQEIQTLLDQLSQTHPSETMLQKAQAQYGIQGARKGESPIGCQVKPCLAFGHCG